MAGELFKELQGAKENQEKERKAEIKHTRELKTHNKKQWLKEERKRAEEIIASIPFKAREEEKSGRKKLPVFFLSPEYLRGMSADTLDGAGKIVYDWCVKEGFRVELISYGMAGASIEIFW